MKPIIKPKVWILEDDTQILEILEFLAETCGYAISSFRTVTEASNALDLITNNEGQLPSLVISDFQLKEKNSKAWMLRFKAKFPNTRIICSSGWVSYNDLKDLRSSGIEFFPKPQSLGKILEVLKKK